MRSNKANPAHSPRHRQQGIILLEVMLAVTIFCLVGLGLAKGAAMAAETLSRANRETRIRLALDGEMAEALATTLQIGVVKTKTTDDGIAFERDWEALPLTASDKTVLSDLYLLTVRARWTENGKDEVQEATLRVYHPQS